MANLSPTRYSIASSVWSAWIRREEEGGGGWRSNTEMTLDRSRRPCTDIAHADFLTTQPEVSARKDRQSKPVQPRTTQKRDRKRAETGVNVDGQR
ncbi:hypothetical protein BO83DRAFT_382434 [Aspergillus eucalypticola CBS 122712]|uniref:Uncharacterized protein n=1 Tax=Aspergillus eucalypticola (strain CBS 122712 / IBT 29274) TaxID=1448314 RepID=A0A317URW5_ASPEC|nr:uncharacterized protein BO83DRAFT_382434 [Aspergillus eucalypticola CBS 122712]PWY63848.1 hypothetical protein BO83DRAFT_382434 [Aspergillus eucalypticola CBS 122712]